MLYFTSDIHGNINGLEKCFQAIGILDKDLNLNPDWPHQMVICGDLVDRGPNPAAVVNLCLQAKQAYGDRFVVVMGNHDFEFYQAWKNPGNGNFETFVYNMEGETTLKSYGLMVNLLTMDHDLMKKLPQNHMEFIGSFPTMHRVKYGGKRILFCHAGLHPWGDLTTGGNKPNEPHDQSILWIREAFFAATDNKFIDKQYNSDLVIFGHTPVIGYGFLHRLDSKLDPSSYISPKWVLGGKGLAIDTGSGYPHGALTISQINEEGICSLVVQV